jgi:magnesium chelatase accessory protein
VKARLDWARDGVDWPHHEASRFVAAAGLSWHVQSFGKGPCLLLLHGTAASVHSWRDLAPILARDHHVIACDLPGHGFTSGQSARDLTLPGMARAVAGLVKALGVKPVALIGHSAGAAVACRMALDGIVRVRMIIGLNAALLPFDGAAGRFAPALARLLFLNPFAPAVFAVQANDGSVARLIRSTGSALRPEGVAFYRRLFSTYSHVGGALGMMAQWDLASLARELGKLTPPLALIVGDRDRAIPPSQSQQVVQKVPHARRIVAAGLGHLAHEEEPYQIAQLIAQALEPAPG